jgi:hypothetical protein
MDIASFHPYGASVFSWRILYCWKIVTPLRYSIWSNWNVGHSPGGVTFFSFGITCVYIAARLFCSLVWLSYIIFLPVPVVARSKAEVCGRSPAEIVGSNPTGGMDVCLMRMCVLLCRSLFDELINRPEESYRLWCVAVCNLETSEWCGHGPRWAAAPQEKK